MMRQNLFYSPLLVFFFFSSRRRHTRWPRDWSSDVCSSDLGRSPRMGSAKAGSMIVAAADARNLIPLIQEFVPERNSCNIGLYIGTVDDFKGFQTSVVGTVGNPSAAVAAGACFPAGFVYL